MGLSLPGEIGPLAIIKEPAVSLKQNKTGALKCTSFPQVILASPHAAQPVTLPGNHHFLKATTSGSSRITLVSHIVHTHNTYFCSE